MRSSTGRWVSGDDFFDRENELRLLEARVQDRNHLVLAGQRRMGKTSILHELARRLECDGWVCLFDDVEGATSPEDVIADIQSFFARLRDFAVMRGRAGVRVEDVDEIYRSELLGPSGQNDLVHYETRLKEALGDEEHRLAMEILAEAATTGVFSPNARRCLDTLYSAVVADASARIADTLEVLVHDGYLEATDDGHRFTSHLLGDWWAARFRDHHVPLANRIEGGAVRRAAR